MNTKSISLSIGLLILPPSTSFALPSSSTGEALVEDQLDGPRGDRGRGGTRGSMRGTNRGGTRGSMRGTNRGGTRGSVHGSHRGGTRGSHYHGGNRRGSHYHGHYRGGVHHGGYRGYPRPIPVPVPVPVPAPVPPRQYQCFAITNDNTEYVSNYFSSIEAAQDEALRVCYNAGHQSCYIRECKER